MLNRLVHPGKEINAGKTAKASQAEDNQKSPENIVFEQVQDHPRSEKPDDADRTQDFIPPAEISSPFIIRQISGHQALPNRKRQCSKSCEQSDQSDKSGYGVFFEKER